MAKKPEITFEKWVEVFVQNVAEYFDLQSWSIKISHKDEDDGMTYAETHLNSVYLFADIITFLPAKRDFEEGSYDKLAVALTHELVHFFLDPFHVFAQPHLSETTTPFFMNMLETQTQRLTQVIFKNLPEELFPPRTANG